MEKGFQVIAHITVRYQHMTRDDVTDATTGYALYLALATWRAVFSGEWEEECS